MQREIDGKENSRMKSTKWLNLMFLKDNNYEIITLWTIFAEDRKELFK